MEFSSIGNKRMADVAGRGENNVKQRAAELLDGIHLKAQVGVDYQYVHIGDAGFTINNGGDTAQPVRRTAIAAKAGGGARGLEAEPL